MSKQITDTPNFQLLHGKQMIKACKRCSNRLIKYSGWKQERQLIARSHYCENVMNGEVCTGPAAVIITKEPSVLIEVIKGGRYELTGIEGLRKHYELCDSCVQRIVKTQNMTAKKIYDPPITGECYWCGGIYRKVVKA